MSVGPKSVSRPKRSGRAFVARLLPQAHVSIAFGDQALISAANFVGGIMFARFLGLHEFGRFSLAWMAAEFIGSLQFAAIIQPMLNIGPKQSPGDSETYYAAVKVQQGIFGLAVTLAVLIAVKLLGHLFGSDGFGDLAVPLAATVAAYQTHAFLRRYFFVRRRARLALRIDVLRYAIQLGGTVAIGLFVYQGMAADTGLWIVAIAAGAGAMPGLLYLGNVRPGVAALVAATRRHWHFSKWLMPSAVMFWMSSQTLFIVSGLVLGATAVGVLSAAKAVAGIINILLLALDNFAPAQAARAFHAAGSAALRRYLGRLAVGAGIASLAVVVILNLEADLIVRLIYGNKFEGVSSIVRIFSIAGFLFTLGTVLVIWSAAIELTKTIFLSQAASAAFSVLAAYPLGRYGGIEGIAIGTVFAEAIRLGYLFATFRKWKIGPTSDNPTVRPIVDAGLSAEGHRT